MATLGFQECLNESTLLIVLRLQIADIPQRQVAINNAAIHFLFMITATADKNSDNLGYLL